MGAAQKTSDKRHRIMDAAVQVFAARGFYNARVSDIAKEAGVAGGTIYLYFKSKDDLLISLFEDRMEGILARFKVELDKLEGAPARLRRFIELHLEIVEEDPTLAEVLTVELRQSAKFMREYKAPKFGEYLNVLKEIIEAGQAAGDFRAGMHSTLFKRLLFGALDEISLTWVSAHRKPYDLQQAASVIWNICARGVLATPSPTNEASAATTGEIL